MKIREWFSKLFLHLKDTIGTRKDEHIHRAIRYARSIGIDSDSTETIIDAGAYDGSTSLLFRKYFPKAFIHAFEPNPHMHLNHRREKLLNSNINFHPTALSDFYGHTYLYVVSNGVSSSLFNVIHDDDFVVETRHTVPVDRLDGWGFGNVSILKMDVQGGELNVIKGAISTLKYTRIVICEMSIHDMYENGAKYYEVDALLREQGFVLIDMIVAYRKKGVQVTEFDSIYSKR